MEYPTLGRELSEYFGAVSSALDKLVGDATFTFERNTIPQAPSRMHSPNIHITRATHVYEDVFQADSLWIQATPNVFRALGLLVLSCLFSPHRESTTLELTHRLTDVTAIVIRPHPSRTAPSGYIEQASSFSYRPTIPERFPWTTYPASLCPDDLPCVFLPLTDEPTDRRGRYRRGVTAYGFGSDRGALLLAQLLLDIGTSGVSCTTYDLECEAGNRGCGPLSTELRLVLPGSEAWNETLWCED